MRSGRIGAVAILALALIGYLRRRVWWGYAASSRPPDPPRPAFVARRVAERLPYAARVTRDWRPLTDQALAVVGAGLLLTERDTLLPAAWIAATGRPDVADLPRVARSEPVQAATQWLGDADRRVVLVVAAVEPVQCSFAVVFDARQHAATLAAAAEGEQLVLVFGAPPPGAAQTAVVPASSAGPMLVLPLDAPAQLKAILAELRIEN